MLTEKLRRVAVTGAAGSGKTYLARALVRRWGVPYVELDALYWDAGEWLPAPVDVFQRHLAEALAGPTWVSDGFYSHARHCICSLATTLVLLDYPLPLVMWRLSWRTLRRVIRHEVLWQGNRVRLRDALPGGATSYTYALKSYARHRHDYSTVLGNPEYTHLSLFRLRSPKETSQWLNEVLAPRPASTGAGLGDPT